MRGSFIILGFFVLGILAGRLSQFPQWLDAGQYSSWVLYLLMFLVGLGVGADRKALRTLATFNVKILMVPLSTIIGTLLGVSVLGIWIKQFSLTELLAVGSGFGYYSLSSVIITELHSAELGVIALLSNVIREVITLLFAPLFVHIFGKLAPISSGGATSMDTTLPIITNVSGREFALVSLFHGIVLTILVPFLVAFFISL
ncbi:MAG: lysine exporter LysO family protein [Bacteroidota bacterium]